MTVYLDNAASTKIDPMVLDEMLPYFKDSYGNPSSLHTMGRNCKKAIEKAREKAAAALNAKPEQIFFVNSATEGNNWVISNYDKVLCSRVEHHSVSNNPKCITMDNRPIAEQIQTEKPTLVSHQLVNNEVGSIYDVKTMAEQCHKMGVQFHTDATQAFSHIPIDVVELGVDSLVLSGHKFHSYGAGVVYLKDPKKYKPLLYGGGQEKGLRSSTENVASIVGLGKAMELFNYDKLRDERILALKSHMIDFIQHNIPDSLINSPLDKTVNNILNVSFKGVEGESVLLLLDNKGICVSSGSACSSGSLEPSQTLKELNIPDDHIFGTIRISFSKDNTLDEIIQTEKILKDIIKKVRGY